MHHFSLYRSSSPAQAQGGCGNRSAFQCIQSETEGAMQAIDRVSTVTIAVADQDEALEWYTGMLGFEKKMDVRSPGFRWLTVALPQQVDVEFLLASWFPDLVGKNATWVLSTRDCQGGYEELVAKGVKFSEKPAVQPWGIQAVFADLYGNKYALVQESAQVVTDKAESTALGLPELPAEPGVAEVPGIQPA
jgi:uncharacterized glyoxalase superfamily protein PhnB